MEFQGSLGNLMIGDIVQILEAKRATGTLSITKAHSPKAGVIYLDEGSIAHVIAPTGRTDPFALCEILEWEGNPEASFEFIAGVAPQVRTVRMFNGSLIIKCEIARDVFALIDQWYGSSNSVLRINPAPPGMPLQGKHWRVLRFVDDTASIREVMAYASDDPSEFIDSLKDLVSSGVVGVEIVEPAPVIEPAPQETPADPSTEPAADFAELVPGGTSAEVSSAPVNQFDPLPPSPVGEVAEELVKSTSPATEYPCADVLEAMVAAINLVCDTYSNTLGAVVLSNYLRKVVQELAVTHPCLSFFDVPRTNFNQGLLAVTNQSALIERFGDNLPALVAGLRDILVLFRRRCASIVGALGNLDIRELSGERRELLEAVGFFDGV